MVKIGIAIVVALWPAAAFAEGANYKVGTVPKLNATITVSIGDPMLEKFNYFVQRVAVPDRSIHVTYMMVPFRIEEGEPMLPEVTRKGLKACSQQEREDDSMFTSVGPVCFVDEDQDGTFDRTDRVGMLAKGKFLAEPVPYHFAEQSVSRDGSFKSIISYLGASNGDLKLSYREFSNGKARPAFTEEMSVPMTKTFPQTIKIKGVTIEIISVDGQGLTYRVTGTR